MTLLLRDPDVKPDGAGATTAPEARACPKCQTPLAPEQDWCLNCGQAQPGRLAGLPGKRAAATVLALTTLLVGGAVAASYAALQDKAAAPVTPPTQVAQTPQPSAPAPAEPAAPAASTPTPAPTDTNTAPPDAGAAPPTPAPSSPAAPGAGTGTNSTPSSKGPTSGGTPSTGGGTTKTDTQAHTRTTTPPALSAPSTIKLADDAVALYDPYKRDSAAGDPAKAHDRDPNTSFPITVADGSAKVGAGIVADLRTATGLRELDLTTKTPGFRVEIYATDSEELPPDVLDTRWAHLKDVSDVGVADAGKQRIVLGSGATKYRHVLLWVTTPPKDGTTVRVSELKALG